MNDLDLEARRKRALWRATHRGIKEMDILIGGFARREVPGMAAAELDEFEAVLDISDQDLLAFATGTLPVPAQQDRLMLRRVLNFRP